MALFVDRILCGLSGNSARISGLRQPGLTRRRFAVLGCMVALAITSACTPSGPRVVSVEVGLLGRQPSWLLWADDGRVIAPYHGTDVPGQTIAAFILTPSADGTDERWLDAETAVWSIQSLCDGDADADADEGVYNGSAALSSKTAAVLLDCGALYIDSKSFVVELPPASLEAVPVLEMPEARLRGAGSGRSRLAGTPDDFVAVSGSIDCGRVWIGDRSSTQLWNGVLYSPSSAWDNVSAGERFYRGEDCGPAQPVGDIAATRDLMAVSTHDGCGLSCRGDEPTVVSIYNRRTNERLSAVDVRSSASMEFDRTGTQLLIASRGSVQAVTPEGDEIWRWPAPKASDRCQASWSPDARRVVAACGSPEDPSEIWLLTPGPE